MTMDELKKVATQLKEVVDALAHLRKVTLELDPELQQKLLDLFFFVSDSSPNYVSVLPRCEATIFKYQWEGNAGPLLESFLLALDSELRDILLLEMIKTTKRPLIADTRNIFEDILGDEQTKKEG